MLRVRALTRGVYRFLDGRARVDRTGFRRHRQLMPRRDAGLGCSHRADDTSRRYSSFSPTLHRPRHALQFGTRRLSDPRPPRPRTYQNLGASSATPQGRGAGNSAPTLKDDWNTRSCRRYQRELGVPRGIPSISTLASDMPRRTPSRLSGAIENNLITDSLCGTAAVLTQPSPEDPPPVRDVCARRAVVTLPRTVETARGRAAQGCPVWHIVIKPRLFAPTVDGVCAGASDGQRLSVASWHDPSATRTDLEREAGRVRRGTTRMRGSTQQGPDRNRGSVPCYVRLMSGEALLLQGDAASSRLLGGG